MIEKFYVSDDVANNIENVLLNDDYFPWFFHSTTVRTDEEIKKSTNVDSSQLTHIFYQNGKINSNYFKNVIKVLQHSKLPLSKIDCVRIKANLNFPLNYQKNLNSVHQSVHIDAPENHKSFLYYVNDSDGDTVIFNEKTMDPVLNGEELSVKKRIKSKRGRFVMFNQDYLHAGMPPTKSDYRVVINFNFKML